jgi:ribonuclease E
VSDAQRPTLVVARDLDEIWLAQCRGGRVHELDVVPASADNRWGSICLARVIEVRPALGGAFVDAGLGEQVFAVGPDRREPPAAGERLFVRIVRDDPVKGPRATASVSLPGLLLVLVPGRPGARVSRRVLDPRARERLKRVGRALPSDEHGWIVRAAAAAASEQEIVAEAARLTDTWAGLESAREGGRPGPVWRDDDPATRFVRERVGLDPERVVVEDRGTGLLGRLREVLRLPGGRDAVPLAEHRAGVPAVVGWGLERAAAEALESRVGLPGGGVLVVEPTEALTAIDVNACRDLRGDHGERAALRVNREAAVEVARQIALRNVAGLIAVDFVDLKAPDLRAEVDAKLAEALGADTSRTRALPMSAFCVVEISRQYRGPSLADRFGRACEDCAGTGWREALPVAARRLLRRVRHELTTAPGRTIEALGPEPVVAEARRLARAGIAGDLHGLEQRVRWISGASVEARPAGSSD